MRFRQGAVILAAGTVLTLAGLAALQHMPAPGTPGHVDRPLIDEPAERAETASASVTLPPAPHPDSIRNVAPQGILPPPVSGPLKRVQSRPPARTPSLVPADMTVFRPVVIDAGTLRVKRLTIRLTGIDAPQVADMCPSRLGGTWPCGRRARTALRAFVRGRAITCDGMEEIAPGLVSARCRRHEQDLGEWMVRQGWARPGGDAGAGLIADGQAARDARKGIWQLEPRAGTGLSNRIAPLASDPPEGTGDRRARIGQPPANRPEGLEELEAMGDAVEVIETPWFPGAGGARSSDPVRDPEALTDDGSKPGE